MFGTNFPAFVIALGLVGYPAVSAVPEFLAVESTSFTYLYRLCVLIASLLLIFARRQRHTTLSINTFWLIYAIFWLTYIFRLVVDALFFPSALRLSVEEYFAYVLGINIIPSIAAALYIRTISLDKLLFYIQCIAIIGILLNLIVIYQQQPEITLNSLLSARQGTHTLNPISFGHLGVTAILCATYGFFNLRLQYARVVNTFCLGLGFVATILAASRGPLLALMILLPLVFYFASSVRRYASQSLKIIILVVAIFGLLVQFSKGLEDISLPTAFVRMQNPFEDSDRSELFVGAYNLIADNFIFGSGVEPLGFHPHNTIVEAFMLNGIFGLILYLSLLGISVLCSFKWILKRGDALWIPILFFQYLSSDMFSGALYGGGVTWTLMCMAIALNREMLHRKQN